MQTWPHTRAHTRTATRVKSQFWFRILSGGDNLLKLAEKLLAANFGAVIALLASGSHGSLFLYLSSKLSDTNSFDAVVVCFAIGFTFNILVILMQKHSLIAAKICGYAGALSSVIGFLIMIRVLLPPTLLGIVWFAAAVIFLSFLYHFRKNWVATEDGNVDTEDENVDTEGEIVLFYWGGRCVYDDRGSVSYNCNSKKFCKVEKGTTLPQLEEMIKPEVAPNEENVQLKFNYRIPRAQSPGFEYALAPINDITALNLVLNERKRLPSISTLEFYVYQDGNVDTEDENVDTEDGNVDTEGGNVDTEDENVDTEDGNVDTEGGNVDTEDENVDTEDGNVDTEGGNVDTEDENVDTEDGNVDTEGENVLFYWGGQCVYDDRGSVSYNCDSKKFCKVEKGTTLPQLEEMIKPEVAPNEENVQLKFNYRIPRVQSPGFEYALAPINNDTDLNLVLNERKRLPSISTLEFYVYR